MIHFSGFDLGVKHDPGKEGTEITKKDQSSTELSQETNLAMVPSLAIGIGVKSFPDCVM